MKNLLNSLIAIGLMAVALAACHDESSEIGTILSQGEVVIEQDSTYVVEGRSVFTPVFDSRSTSNLIGRLYVPEYGSLECSYVSQMLAVSSLNIPDSISEERIDSMKMFIRLPRLTITGDSLAPQQLTIYRLNKQLPSDIKNNFNPEGYYSKSDIIGSRNYSMTALGMNDSIYKNATTIDVQVPLSLDYAKAIFRQYRTNPEMFQWPLSFNKEFPGIFVKSTFGRGCVANVSNTDFVIYWYHKALRVFKNDDGTTYKKEIHVKDSVTVFSNAPEVLSSNNITFTPSESLKNMIANGETIIAAPSGYNVEIRFPLKEIIESYSSNKYSASIISDLTFEVPASTVKNDYSVNIAPYLLMVKTSELNDFFENNRLPDGKTSFYARFSSDTGGYTFDSMRDYLINMINKGTLDEDDYMFTLLPVYVSTETYLDSDTYENVTVVTGCTPYIVRPTMTRLYLNKAKVKFTYSLQQL